MKLGFVSAILPEMCFEEIIDFAAKERFQCVEFMCWPVGKAERRYAGVTHIDIDNLDANRIAYIQKYASDHGVEISGLGYYPNPLDEDLEKREVYVDHLRKVIDAAGRLGVGVVNTFIGRMRTKNLEDNLTEYVRVWTPIIEYAMENNVRIGIENCPMYFSWDEWPSGNNIAVSPYIWHRMFELIASSNLGLNYDPSHLLWQQMDYIKPIYEFKDRIVHVHIKDAKLYRDKLDQVGIFAPPLEYHSPKLPGLGDIEWGDFFSALTDIRYRGHVVIEVEDKSYEDSLEARQYAVCQSRDYISSWIGKR